MSTKSTKNLPPSVNSALRGVFGERFYQNHSIAEFTSTNLGGVADFLVIAESIDELVSAASIASRYQLPFVVIAGGTGVLVSDVGMAGLVIINRTSRIIFDETSSQVVVDSGVVNDHLLNISASRGLGGIEFLTAIPGTIGGAIATSAGYQNALIKSAFRELMLWVPTAEGGQVITVTSQDLMIAPYEPFLSSQSTEGQIILTIRLQLARIDQTEILRRLFQIRRTRHAFFKGNRLGRIFTQSLSELPIDRSGLRRLKSNGATVFGKDPDILLRTGNSTTAAQMKDLINAIKESAMAGGFQLDERLGFLGYWPDEERSAQPIDPTDAESFSV